MLRIQMVVSAEIMLLGSGLVRPGSTRARGASGMSDSTGGPPVPAVELRVVAGVPDLPQSPVTATGPGTPR
jgi:hypothetical protein